MGAQAAADPTPQDRSSPPCRPHHHESAGVSAHGCGHVVGQIFSQPGRCPAGLRHLWRQGGVCVVLAGEAAGLWGAEGYPAAALSVCSACAAAAVPCCCPNGLDGVRAISPCCVCRPWGSSSAGGAGAWAAEWRAQPACLQVLLFETGSSRSGPCATLSHKDCRAVVRRLRRGGGVEAGWHVLEGGGGQVPLLPIRL